MMHIAPAIVAVADAVQAVATVDPEVVAIRSADRSRARQLRALRLLRVLKARLARLQASRGASARKGRLAALGARIAATEAILTNTLING